MKKLAILLTILTMALGLSFSAVACKDDDKGSSSKQTGNNLDDNDVTDPWGDRSDLA
jgi:hypothetical protein